MPATPTSSNAELRSTLYIRSVPMLPEPRIATASAIVHHSSEHRDRVDRRPGALFNAQRGNDAQEFPSALLLAGRGEFLEAQAVGVVQAHGADPDRVDRVGDAFALAGDRLAAS